MTHSEFEARWKPAGGAERANELFDAIQARRYDYAPGSEEWTYAQTLGTACMLFGPANLFPLLEEAARTGKRVALVEDLTVLGSPTAIVLE